MTERIRVIGTQTLLELVEQSNLSRPELTEMLDPDGQHVCQSHFFVNETDITSVWLVKLRDTLNPHIAAITVPAATFMAIPNRPVEELIPFTCDNCGKHATSREKNPLYECGKCGHIFPRDGSYPGGLGHQCPECAGMGKKLSDYACPACERGSLVAKRETE